ncbi:hypothetical protein QSJ18_20055 [Gordonia sp. ABSL1-1]|uniref:CopG family ribbon-helix-helix protein n=1 Tax=Gordonia sp. ABSL1-1 TaxID=3053923 RepID=UPI0025725B6A|nr:hypothetical protein [Gordonia sp. ABSL1-1]MDL9939041.1 hypothetical protein [Gordonia sp. ABSL1-1]
MTRKTSDADYSKLADSYAADPPTADEIVGEVEVVDAAALRTGRPRGGVAVGKTPTMSVRVPLDIRAKLDRLAEVEHVKPAEIARRALVEYTERHTV